MLTTNVKVIEKPYIGTGELIGSELSLINVLINIVIISRKNFNYNDNLSSKAEISICLNSDFVSCCTRKTHCLRIYGVKGIRKEDLLNNNAEKFSSRRGALATC
jgi:hypothetical protein